MYRRSAPVRRCHVAAPIEVAKVFVRFKMRGLQWLKRKKNGETWPPVAGRELVGEHLGAHPVDGHREAVVGDRRVPDLDGPQRLAESADGGRRVEDDFSA